MNQLKIVFMGTATFSEAVLKNLIQHDYNIVQVVSQPDRRVGRKKELKMPEVKVVALEHDIPVFQPQRIKEDYQAILDMQPDLIITAAYGQMIPQEVLDCHVLDVLMYMLPYFLNIVVEHLFITLF